MKLRVCMETVQGKVLLGPFVETTTQKEELANALHEEMQDCSAVRLAEYVVPLAQIHMVWVEEL